MERMVLRRSTCEMSPPSTSSLPTRESTASTELAGCCRRPMGGRQRAEEEHAELKSGALHSSSAKKYESSPHLMTSLCRSVSSDPTLFLF